MAQPLRRARRRPRVAWCPAAVGRCGRGRSTSCAAPCPGQPSGSASGCRCGATPPEWPPAASGARPCADAAGAPSRRSARQSAAASRCTAWLWSCGTSRRAVWPAPPPSAVSLRAGHQTQVNARRQTVAARQYAKIVMLQGNLTLVHADIFYRTQVVSLLRHSK